MVSRGITKLSRGVLLLTTLIITAFAQSLVDKVVASVNGEPILESDVKLGMLFYGTNNKKEVLDRLVDTYLLAQFLESKGGKVPEEYLNDTLLNLAKANNTDLEGLAKELSKEGLTLEDLKRFLSKEILATQGLISYLSKEIKVSATDLELEKLKSGGVKVKRDVELLVVDKKDGDKLIKLMEEKKSFDEIAKALGIKPESLSVERGELVEPLDKEVWRVSVGSLAVAEDENHIYLALVKNQREVYSGELSEEELRNKVFWEKIEERQKELLENLRKRSFIKLVS